MNILKKKFLIIIGVAFISFNAFSHCEIPCGIYHDSLRINLIKEHISTIEKSMMKINELKNQDTPNYNQLVRWISNKEEHANKIQNIATQYFMFQRIKVSNDKHLQRRNSKMLKLLHELCVYAMKSKQTTDLDFIVKINRVVEKFSTLYFQKKKHKHFKKKITFYL